MTPDEMKHRTKVFALRIVKMVGALPGTNRQAISIMGRQVLRSGTSVAANYRSACRARSKPDFISKMGIVEEEADESMFWMEMLVDAGLVKKERMEPLIRECEEILAIIVASINTARGGKRKVPIKKPQSKIRNPQSAIRN